MAGTANGDHAQQLNALEQQLAEATGHTARLKAEVESWAQKMADAAKETGVARSECGKLSRDIISLKIQVQQSTEMANAAKGSLEVAEKEFEEKRKVLRSERHQY